MLDVIYIDSLSDTSEFSHIIDGLEANVLINPSRHAVRQLLSSSNNDLLLFGHGDENGLYNMQLNGYIIDSREVNLLRTRTVIGIWCFAGNFADRYGLHGFFTSMFISNITEAIHFNFTATQEDITIENTVFAEQIGTLLRQRIPYSQWVRYLQDLTRTSTLPFVRYNYEALVYFD